MRPVLLSVADRVRRTVWKLFGPRTVGVRGLVVDGDRRVLLVRHTYGPQLWHLPGGGVQRRESIADALARELREEVGIEVAGRPELLGTYSSLAEGKSDHITVFVVAEWSKVPARSTEIARHEWFAADALPDDVSRGTRRRIEEWTSGTRDRRWRW